MTSNRWLRLMLVVALVASLIANVFLLGYLLRGQQEFPGASLIVENIASAYPAEIRSEFRKILRENRDRAASAFEDLREARSKLAAVANASPFDEAEVRRAMADVRSHTDNLQGLMQEFLLEAIRTVQQTQRL